MLSVMPKRLGLLLVTAAMVLAGCQPATPDANANAERTATVTRGTIRASVSASGSIAPAQTVNLNFGVPGTVAEITVAEGQAVKTGDVLARLDTDELRLAVQQAENAVATQKIVYSQAISPTLEDVNAAKSAVASASANLRQLAGNPDPLQVQIAQLQADVANETRYQTELRYDQVRDKPVGGMQVDTLRSQYAQTVMQAQIAELQLELTKRGGNDAQLAAARAQLTQAQAQLAKLQGDERTRALAEAQLRNTEIALEQARLRLKNAQLVAPFDGTIAELNLSIGQQVGTGGLQAAIVLADLSSFHIDVGVDESSVGVLAEEQPVVITVDALPDQQLTGRVDRIAPVATEQGGIVNYKVVIGLEQGETAVRGGMSANVDIITEVRDNVLIVPNWTIRIDRGTGKTYVNLRQGDKINEVEIVTGLRNTNESEVVSGVNEGDELVVVQQSGLSLGN
jgi:HlyD family secretion protein